MWADEDGFPQTYPCLSIYYAPGLDLNHMHFLLQLKIL